MNPPAARFTCWVAASLLLACALPDRAEDWFVKGRTYTNVRVIRVNADTVSINYDGGTGRLALADLPEELGKRFAPAAHDAQAFAELEKKADTDAIDHLLVKLEPTNGMWRSGPWEILKLSPDAHPADLIAVMKDLRGAKVLEVRPVQIDSLPFTAVRVNVASGPEIVLLMYLDAGANGGFWGYRVYPSEL
jgi:hypothetical protein